MKRDGDRPMLGASSSTLGVRTPGGAGIPDIMPDPDGNVAPGTGGMSVSPSVMDLVARLPPTFIPKRLRALVPDARGSNNVCVWRMGEGPFAPAPVTDRLSLRPDPADPGHGFLEPATTLALQQYVHAIVATRDSWVVDEEAEAP
jgi:hypothetical protein